MTDKEPSQELDDVMFLNEERYKRDYQPAYAQIGIEPTLLVQFPIILPFHVPLRSGTCVTFDLSENEACTLCFGNLTTRQGVHAGVVGGKPIMTTVHRSSVEMTFVFGDRTSVPSDHELSSVFDRLMEALNHLVVAYMAVTEDYRVHRVTKEMLEFGSLWRAFTPSPWKEEAAGIFLLHWQVPIEKPELDAVSHERVVWYASVLKQGWNPFILPKELLLSARRELLGGVYRDAVIFAQTAVETFLSLLLTYAMKEEGMQEAEIESMMVESSFVTRLRKEYHHRFGGNWVVSSPSGEVSTWYNKTYGLRNRVAHGGYLPSWSEATSALDAATEMLGYCTALVERSRKRYPQLQRYFSPS